MRINNLTLKGEGISPYNGKALFRFWLFILIVLIKENYGMRFHWGAFIVNEFLCCLMIVVLYGTYTVFNSSMLFAQDLSVEKNIDKVTISIDDEKLNTSFNNSINKTPIKELTIDSEREQKKNDNSYIRTIISSIGGLALVLGVFLSGIYCLKLLSKGRIRGVSPGVSILDSCYIGRKTELVTIKWGTKVILLAFISGKAPVVISEIADPTEIENFVVSFEEKRNSHKGELKI